MKITFYHAIITKIMLLFFAISLIMSINAQNIGKAIMPIEHFSTLSPNYKYDTLFADKAEYITESFGVPLGVPDGKGYYVAKPFWAAYSNLNHLGEDWSGVVSGNSDFGDTIYAIASGCVTFSEDLGYTWGGVVGMVHKVENKLSVFNDKTIVHDTCKLERGKYRYLESFYAHTESELVKQGQWVKKGDPIATMGNSNGRFLAHLHLELRSNADGEIYDGGYSKSPEGFINPSKFMKAYNEK